MRRTRTFHSRGALVAMNKREPNVVQARPSIIDERLSASLTAVAAALRACAETVDSLALTAASRQSASPAAQADNWPDLMSTSVAARYCGYKTTGGLRKAHFDRKVFPTGRRGGVGSWTWARADLDRFLRGGEPTVERDSHDDLPKYVVQPTSNPVPTQQPPKPERRVTGKGRRPSPHVEEALRRLKAIVRNPQR